MGLMHQCEGCNTKLENEFLPLVSWPENFSAVALLFMLVYMTQLTKHSAKSLTVDLQNTKSRLLMNVVCLARNRPIYCLSWRCVTRRVIPKSTGACLAIFRRIT